MSAPQEPQGASALIAALAAENESLRGRLAALEEQVAALQRVHRELVSSPTFRLTAPLRRVQELYRLRKQDQRRAAGGGPASATLVGQNPPRITDDQAVRSPLLARTRQFAAGAELDGPVRLTPPPPTGRRVLVIAHVFYPDLWPELAEHITRISEPFDLAVTLVEGVSDGLLNAICEAFPNCVVETVPNRGRDMLPLLRVLDLGLISGHDAVLKIHTKKSAHRRDGGRWRLALLDSLCPAGGGTSVIIDLLRSDPTAGVVAPDGYILGSEFWAGNSALIEAMAFRAGVAFDPRAVWFPAGSMFWCRPEILAGLMQPNLTEADFEYEVAALDGTTAHGLERYVGVVAANAGMDVVSTAEVAGRLARLRAHPGASAR